MRSQNPEKEVEQVDIYARHGILKPLSKTMAAELVFDKAGNVSILHGAQLPYLLKWIEWDPDTQRLTLVGQEGQLQDMGFKVPEKCWEAIEKIYEIAAVHVDSGQIKDICLVPLMKPYIDWN